MNTTSTESREWHWIHTGSNSSDPSSTQETLPHVRYWKLTKNEHGDDTHQQVAAVRHEKGISNSTAPDLKLHKTLSAQEFVSDQSKTKHPLSYCTTLDNGQSHSISKSRRWYFTRPGKFGCTLGYRSSMRKIKIIEIEILKMDRRPQRTNWMGNRESGYHEEVTVVERPHSAQGGSEGTWK